MVSVAEVFKTWQEGFTNKDSNKIAEFFTDDFELVGANVSRSCLLYTSDAADE